MSVRVFVLAHDIARQRAVRAVQEAPDEWVVRISEPNRTLEQNAAQWPILEAFSEQILWPVNGQMVAMSSEEWKDVLTAAFRNETARLAMGLNGGVVMLGLRTRDMKKPEFSAWLDFLHATAMDRGVVVYRNEVG